MSASTGTPSPTLPSTTAPITVITPILPIPITPTITSTTPSSISTSSSSSSTGASSSSIDSQTSSSSTSDTASSTTPTTESTSTTPSTNRISITSLSSTSNLPAVITEVSTTFVSASQSSIPTAAIVKNTTGNAFFQNKGAVAGVFSVVGLIGLVILIALIINIIRRREARKFDKELSLATQEARATAPNVNFLDEEDDDPKLNGYSDGSHGPYGQLDGPHGTYGQAQQLDPYMRGEFYTPYPNNGAGIGTGIAAHARSERVAHYDPYAAMQGGSAYPPFVLAPGDTYGGPPGRGNEHGAAIIPGGQQYPQRSPPPDLGRSKSTSTANTQPSTPSHTSNYPQPSYPVGEVIAKPILPNPHTEHSTRKVGPPAESADDDAAYGGYVEDDVEEEVPKRVLKIANES